MKPGSNRLKKAYALIAASCLCTGSLLILKSFWELYTGTLTAGAADAPAAFFLPGLTETESIRAEFFLLSRLPSSFFCSLSAPYYLVGRKKAPSACMGRSVFIDYSGRIICVPAEA